MTACASGLVPNGLFFPEGSGRRPQDGGLFFQVGELLPFSQIHWQIGVGEYWSIFGRMNIQELAAKFCSLWNHRFEPKHIEKMVFLLALSFFLGFQFQSKVKFQVRKCSGPMLIHALAKKGTNASHPHHPEHSVVALCLEV